MKESEEKAAWAYQDILDQCLLGLSAQDEVVGFLRELVREERDHTKLTEELLKICHRNHPEIGVF